MFTPVVVLSYFGGGFSTMSVFLGTVHTLVCHVYYTGAFCSVKVALKLRASGPHTAKFTEAWHRGITSRF